MDTNNDSSFSRRSLLRGMGTALGGTAVTQMFGCSDTTQQVTRPHPTNPGPQKEPSLITSITIPANYYQQYDGDLSLDVPEENFGGWKKAEFEFAREHMAVVVMHAWNLGTAQEFPGWWRAIPWARRAKAILSGVFPPLLAAVRASGIPLFHISSGNYHKNLPGYKRTVALAGAEPLPLEQVQSDPLCERIMQFRREHGWPGGHNQADQIRGRERLDFPEQARPLDHESIAETSHQLFALCKYHKVNHLVYCGFCANWCVLMSPGGMVEMKKYGLMCSIIRQATTAVENKETARKELGKEIALWRTSVNFGLVFDVDDFTSALRKNNSSG